MTQEVSIAAVQIPLRRTAGLPPNGIYRCVIRKVDLNDGPSGYKYMSCECGIDDKDHPDASGKTFFANLSLSPKARWKLEEALNALGAPEDGKIDSTQWFMGKRFYAMLQVSEFEGTKRLQLEEWIDREEVKERLEKWRESAAYAEAQATKKKEAAKSAAAELAPDTNEEPEIAEPELEPDPDLDEALDDLWDD